MSIEAAPESQQSTSNLRVSEFTPLPTPQAIVADLPLDTRLADVVARGRDEVRAIMDGVDDRLESGTGAPTRPGTDPSLTERDRV